MISLVGYDQSLVLINMDHKCARWENILFLLHYNPTEAMANEDYGSVALHMVR